MRPALPLSPQAPLAGKSGVTDAFPGAFEPSTSLCAFAWPSSSFGRSACCLGLLVGEAGCSESSGVYRHVSTCLTAIFACTPSPCVAMCMFSMPMASGLGLVVSPGKSRVFDAFRHVLMVPSASAVVFVPLQMTGTSLCPLNTSTDFQSHLLPLRPVSHFQHSTSRLYHYHYQYQPF